MTRERKRSPDRGREQRRVRARAHTERLRDGHDELDLPDDPVPLPGPLVPGTDLGREDEFDDDLLPDEDEEVSSDEDVAERAGRPTLASLLGSRPLTVHLRLVEESGRVTVRIVARPGTETAREALEELRELIQHIFESGRDKFTAAEWEMLLGRAAAPVGQRLVLLTRLAVRADAVIETATVPFVPHDRGLRRYHGKIAALPDGLPFSMRLLLLDRRGRSDSTAEATDSGLLDLPDAVLLLAVRRTLAAERITRKARSDYDIGPELRRTLKTLGVNLRSAPDEEEVRTLRERRAWHELGLFPNARQRQRDYNRGKEKKS